MAASDLTAGTVMQTAASLLNDTARTTYTDAAVVPYLRIALQELREMFELNSISVTQEVSAVITLTAGQTTVSYNAVFPLPSLPNDFVEPLQVWERQSGIDPFMPMTRRDFLPHYLDGNITSQFIFYAWNGQELKVMPANQSNDLKLDYIRQLFNNIVDASSLINVVNAQTFLEFRTAALVAEFVERNVTSANALNNMAIVGLDRVTGISSKSKQTISTRRRPFRGSYKRGGWNA